MVGAALLILVNATLLVAFFVYFRRRIDRALETGTIVKAIQDEVNQMIVDINGTTDRNIALIEERIERLQGLLAGADKRISVLKRESERGKVAEEVYTQLKPRGPLAEAPVPPAAPKPTEPPAAKSPREEVLELHSQGMDSKRIASKVNKTLGEVELIISLGERRR